MNCAPLIQQLGAAYDAAAQQATDQFREGLSLGKLFQKSIRSTLGRKPAVKNWLGDIQTEFEKDLKAKSINWRKRGPTIFWKGCTSCSNICWMNSTRSKGTNCAKTICS